MRVVFDTNVVASASFWREVPFECLTAWSKGACEAALSPELIAEYHETMDELRQEYPDRFCVEWAIALAETAKLVFPSERVQGATLDPFDDIVLECTIAAEASVVVTGDKTSAAARQV